MQGMTVVRVCGNTWRKGEYTRILTQQKKDKHDTIHEKKQRRINCKVRALGTS